MVGDWGTLERQEYTRQEVGPEEEKYMNNMTETCTLHGDSILRSTGTIGYTLIK